MFELPIELPIRWAAGQVPGGVPAPQILLSSSTIDDGQPAGTVYALISVLEPRATISLSSLSFDDGQAAGTALATMAVGMPWTYTLIDDAGGRFALSGSNVVAGQTPLDALTRPTETITIAATDGKRTVRRTYTIVVRKALPALPLAAGAKVMGFGHSFIGRSGYGIASGAPTTPYTRVDVSTAGWVGDLGSLRAFDRRFNLDTWFDVTSPFGVASPSQGALAGSIAGVGGWKLADLLGCIDYVIARRPQIIILDIITNDINSRVGDLAYLKAQYQVVLDKLRGAGILVLALMPVVRTDWPVGDDRHATQAAFGDWLATLGGDGLYVIDDRADLAAAITAGKKVSEDGVHMTAAGHLIRTGKMLPVLRSLVSPGDWRPADYATGNLAPFSGGFTTTTPGNKSGVTGTMATGLNATRLANAQDAIVASVVDGKQVLEITPATNANTSRVSSVTLTFADINFAAKGISVGDWIEAGFDLELSASDAWISAAMQLEANGGTYYVALGGIGGRLNELNPGPDFSAAGFSGRVTIAPFQVLGAGVIANPASYFRTSLRPITLSWLKTAPSPLTAKISPIWVRKVTDPRPAWNL